MEITIEEIQNIIKDLKNRNSETPCIEVKETQLEKDKLGETIAGISNSCLLEDREFGYIIFGVKDDTWEIVGTDKKLANYKVGNQEIILYLSTLLNPLVEFKMEDDILIEGKKLSVIKIHTATHTPISYKKEIYIRIGSNVKPAKEFPEKLKILWGKTTGFDYEQTIVKENLTEDEVLTLLDYRNYYGIKNLEIPNTKKEIIFNFIKDGFIIEKDNNNYSIKALGALLIANNLQDFGLERKGVRVIIYNGKTKSKIKKQLTGTRGYAVGFTNLIRNIERELPIEERFDSVGIRKTYEFYPKDIIRELVANAIIHQDLNIKGFETRIEIYEDRVEITNPGKALIDIWQFYNCNRSRNEKLAYFMREIGICEELGSGIDRIVEISEKENRFTPKYITNDEYVNVKLFKEKNFDQMTDDDKMNILYYHCCYSYSVEDYMSNTSLRARFLLDNSKTSIDKISRLIKKAKESNLIKPSSSKTYIPFWAE